MGFIQFVTCYIQLYPFFVLCNTFGIKLSVSSVIIEQLLSFVPKINDSLSFILKIRNYLPCICNSIKSLL